MPKKLYSSEYISEIANTIRDLTDYQKTFTTAEMPQAIVDVYDIAQETGWDIGYAVGQQESYSAGYADGHSDGYNNGYADGYDEGLSEGSGGGIGDVEYAPLIEQAKNIQSIIDLNDIDPWISDEFQRRYAFPIDTFGQVGYQFFDIIGYETSDPRSCPITVTFYNYNSRLTAHVVYEISDNAMQEYWYSVVDIPPEESVSESFDSESSRGSDWVIEIIGAYFTYD